MSDPLGQVIEETEEGGRANGYAHITLPGRFRDEASGYAQGLTNAGCEIEEWREYWTENGVGATTYLRYKLPWLVSKELKQAEARIALQNKQANQELSLNTIQAFVDTAIRHGETELSFKSSNWPSVQKALLARGMWPKEISQDQHRSPDERTCTVKFGPNPMARELQIPTPTVPGTAYAGYPVVGTVVVSNAHAPLRPIAAAPLRDPKPKPGYWELRKAYITTDGAGLKELDAMLARVTLTEPDLDKVIAEPDPHTSEMDSYRRQIALLEAPPPPRGWRMRRFLAYRMAPATYLTLLVGCVVLEILILTGVLR